MTTTNVDALLERAVKLARRGTGLVEPNPRVGALVLRHGEVVGEGWHREYGGPHAEVVALGQAGERARGADLFLTLEPCSTHGKTDPCTDAIIATGIQRVIYAVADPNPRNGGRARAILAEAGIAVEELPPSPAALELLADFRHYQRRTLPWVILKWAMTADGKVCTTRGDSRWIASEESRREGHAERRRADAVVVGRATVRVDDPELTVRMVEPGHRRAVRVVLDSNLHLDPTCKLIQSAQDHPTWVIHCAGAEAEGRRAAIEALGARTVRVPPSPSGRLDLRAALAFLRSEDLHRILVEGGPTVHGALLSEGLADWARVYVAPLLVGGITAPGPVAGPGFPSLDQAVWLQDTYLRIVGHNGSDLALEGRISRHIEAP
jgi:diaminohydroxyphosphoribosylaminopyrimidine deaminase/5-amino-6-(5-phosphoribosylamino)uracil reductase